MGFTLFSVGFDRRGKFACRKPWHPTPSSRCLKRLRAARSSNHKAFSGAKRKVTISFCPSLPSFLLADFKPLGANESGRRHGARPQLRARPLKSNCRGGDTMARPGLSAAVGECLGQRGAADCLRGPCCRLACLGVPVGVWGTRETSARGEPWDPADSSPAGPAAALPGVTAPVVGRGCASRRSQAPPPPPGSGWPPRASSLHSGRWPGGRVSRVPTSQVGRRLDSVSDDTCWPDASWALHLTTRPVKWGASVPILWLSSGKFVNVLDVPELGSQPACQTPQHLLSTAWRSSGSQGCVRAGW